MPYSQQPVGDAPPQGYAPQGYGPPQAPPAQDHPTIPMNQPLVIEQQQGQQPAPGQPRQDGVGYDPSRLPPPPQREQPYQQYPQFQGQQPAPQQPPQPQQPQGVQQAIYDAGREAGQQAQGAGRLELHDDAVLDGPAVPAELRGRTFGQVKQIYNALAQEWLARQPGAPAPQPQHGVSHQYQAPNVPQGQQQLPPQGQGQGQEPGDGDDDNAFWQSPGRFMRQAIRSEVEQATQPLTQQSRSHAIAQAKLVAQQGIADFGQLEGRVMEIVSRLDPSKLTAPETWIGAADLARGQLMRTGGAGNGGGGQPQPQPQPPRSVPANMAPHYSFFTEAPTAPQVGSPTQLTAQQAQAAAKFGMTHEQYSQWLRGVST